MLPVTLGRTSGGSLPSFFLIGHTVFLWASCFPLSSFQEQGWKAFAVRSLRVMQRRQLDASGLADPVLLPEDDLL